MILIPELEKIILMPPKTGSTALKDAILKKYPLAFVLYRHGEANMIPHGYDTWEKLGLIRDPLDRLYSLFCYLETFGHQSCELHADRMRDSVSGVHFSKWLLDNNEVFSYGFVGPSIVTPYYLVSCQIPETRKSQLMTLRPDLGTHIVPFEHIAGFADKLGITLNRCVSRVAPAITIGAQEHMRYYFKDDYETHARLTR